MIAVYSIVGLVVVVLIVFIAIYNRLVNTHNQIKNLWAQVDVQLTRRHDLISNLIKVVGSYLQHERGTLETVINALKLAEAASSASMVERAKAESQLDSALTRLLAVAEQYPELKANQNALALQQQLTSTEDSISIARKKYNDMVMMCNNLHQQFPSNMVARILGYRTEEFFEVKSPEEKTTPRASFL